MSGDDSDTRGASTATLVRDLGLLALVATAVCNVIGGGINVLSVGIQQKVPGIGPYVPIAFLIGVVPALFAALSYAILSSAMPRAGGGYVYVSRALHPFVGFIATFSKWFGMAAAIGVIAYMDVALLASGVGYLEAYMEVGPVVSFLTSPLAKLIIPIAMIWTFWFVNLLGVRTYGRTVIVLMALMLTGGLAVIVSGFAVGPERFAAAFDTNPGVAVLDSLAKGREAGRAVGGTFNEIAGSVTTEPGGLLAILKAAAWLFFAYIGFAGISQAGGEARDARRVLPRAFVIATAVICTYYLLFTWSVYHATGWKFVAGFVGAAGDNASVPLIIGVIMPPALASFVAIMAALALANDIPPMLLATSRLFFAWARDGVFPRGLAAINSRFRTPHWALTACALVSTAYALICYKWTYFAAIDTVVIALIFTYLLVAVSVLTLPKRNPAIFTQVAFIRSRTAQIAVAFLAIASLSPLLLLELVVQDTRAISFWLGALVVGASIFLVMWRREVGRGEDMRAVFATLPSKAEELEEMGTPAVDD